jgi:ATP-dependent phosphoenolpyruvate carboxykinase
MHTFVDPNYRLNVRVITEKPGQIYFATICHDLKQLNLPILHEWTVLCVPSLWLILLLMERVKQFCYFRFHKVVLIGGTGYTGEMKRNFLCFEFHFTCFQYITYAL